MSYSQKNLNSCNCLQEYSIRTVQSQGHTYRGAAHKEAHIHRPGIDMELYKEKKMELFNWGLVRLFNRGCLTEVI